MSISKNRKLVSVIIPVYNVEKYIKKCVESVLCQTYTKLQIILVDDGSPDNCPQICDDYASRDSRITAIHQINKGLSAARNIGLDNAWGEYIFFVDSDDYLDKYVIENMVELAEKNEADLVLCDFACVDEQGNILHNIFSNNLEESIMNSTQMIARSLEDGSVVLIVAWNKLYRKELWKKYRYPVGKIHEDEFAFHHIVSQCKTIVSTDYVGYYYMQREGSIMSTRSLKSRLDLMDAHIDRLDYISSDMKNFAQNLISHCYFACSELYQFKKDRQLLREYLQKIKSNYKTVFDDHVPIKYRVTYYGLWYVPNSFSLLLRQYRELWNTIIHMKTR